MVLFKVICFLCCAVGISSSSGSHLVSSSSSSSLSSESESEQEHNSPKKKQKLGENPFEEGARSRRFKGQAKQFFEEVFEATKGHPPIRNEEFLKRVHAILSMLPGSPHMSPLSYIKKAWYHKRHYILSQGNKDEEMSPVSRAVKEYHVKHPHKAGYILCLDQPHVWRPLLEKYESKLLYHLVTEAPKSVTQVASPLVVEHKSIRGVERGEEAFESQLARASEEELLSIFLGDI